MAMDVVEITRDNPKNWGIHLVTKDSDFVPVLQWAAASTRGEPRFSWIPAILRCSPPTARTPIP
jgi:hypothetical protein